MTYRTKTYIAGDWTGDQDAIEKLKEWNDGNKWSLSFTDAHDITSASDNSLNCSIKASLNKRFEVTKTFILIVGKDTKSRRAGECTYCADYFWGTCSRGKSIANDSFIEYECKKAVKDDLKIVVLYNAATVDKSKCPDAIKAYGTHATMEYIKDGKRYWDYNSVKQALEV